MNKKIVKVVLAYCFLGSALLGCSVEGKNDYGSYYQKQASLDVLKMPPGISAQGTDNYYVVPPGPMADVKTISILPPGSRAYQSALEKNAKAKGVTPAVDTTSAVSSTPVATPVTNDNLVATTTAEPTKQ
jgi:uncharacterized lipoprotein